MLFQDAHIKCASTKDNGDRLTTTFEPPGSVDGLCGCIGMQFASQLRRFHGKDGRGHWSTTHVDPTKDMKLTWGSKTRTSRTPTGILQEKKSVLSIKFYMDTDVLVHEEIREVMKQEEKGKTRKHLWEDPSAQIKSLQATVNRQGGATLDHGKKTKTLKKALATHRDEFEKLSWSRQT